VRIQIPDTFGKALGKWFWPVWLLATLAGFGIVAAQMVTGLGYTGQLGASVMPDKGLTVREDIRVGQTFVAERPSMDRVDVLLYGFRQRNTQPVMFELRLQGTEESLVNITFEASEVWGWRWKRFEFAPIADSEGKAYEFFLYSPTSRADDSISPSGVVGDVYGGGTVFYLGAPQGGDMAFRVYYDGVTTQEKLSVLGDRITEGRPWMLGDITFYILLAILYLLLVLRLFWYIAERGLRTNDKGGESS
jgi:hypothetical protein